MKDQEFFLPHASLSLTAHAHSTAVVTCEGAVTWLASKLCLTVPLCQTTLEIISGDREEVVLARLRCIKCLVEPL